MDGPAVAGKTGPKWELVAQERVKAAIRKFSDSGVWRTVPVAHRIAELVIVQEIEGDDKNFSDITTLVGRVEWIVRGREYGRRT